MDTHGALALVGGSESRQTANLDSRGQNLPIFLGNVFFFLRLKCFDYCGLTGAGKMFEG